MNPKRDKIKEKIFNTKTFHSPPENKGVYAFIWPYIELFLIAWNDAYKTKTGKKDEFDCEIIQFKNIKKFQHHGEIWCHFVDQARQSALGLQYKDSWVKVNTNDLFYLLQKVIAQDCKLLKKYGHKQKIHNPYKRGSGYGLTMTRDHLEVFIPNKIKESK